MRASVLGLGGECMPEYPVSKLVLKDRLALYHLEAPEEIGNLEVSDHQTLVLTADSRRFQGHLRELRPESLHDLKRWIGVPHASARLDRAPASNRIEYVATADRYRMISTPHLRLGSKELETKFTWALVNDISATPKHELNEFAHLVSAFSITAALFQDIYVGRNATLICDERVQVLFARHISLDHGARIQMQAPVSRIDCAGITSFRAGFSPTATLTDSPRRTVNG
ncbi:MAG: hypothetical protein JWQ42_1421 [Edaphobacter sp.]|nr:hypothetical protein [Edaphobacter sp.]